MTRPSASALPAPPEYIVNKPESIEALQQGDTRLMRLAIARSWMTQHPHEDRAFAVEGSLFRHSWAGKCARATRYNIEGREETEPPDVAALWVFRLGQLVHDEIEPALEAIMPGVRLEVLCVSPDVDGSCSIDAMLNFADGTHQTVEIKSLGGFGFKTAVGAGAKKEGPRFSSVAQLALNAHAQRADLAKQKAVKLGKEGMLGGWLIMVALENLSVGMAERANRSVTERFMEVVYYPIDDLEEIAADQIEWVRPILDAHAASQPQSEYEHQNPAEIDHYEITPRDLPEPIGARVTNPKTGAYDVLDDQGNVIDKGKTWMCDYCSFQTLCVEEGA